MVQNNGMDRCLPQGSADQRAISGPLCGNCAAAMVRYRLANAASCGRRLALLASVRVFRLRFGLLARLANPACLQDLHRRPAATPPTFPAAAAGPPRTSATPLLR